jgi:hypothetical protein
MEGHENITFCRTFGTEETTAWGEIRANLPPLYFGGQCLLDTDPSGIFYVSLVYRTLLRGLTLPWTIPLWKARLPLKTKIFVWQLPQDHLSSLVEVAKRHGLGAVCGHYMGSLSQEPILCSLVSQIVFCWSFVQEAMGHAPRILRNS